ncbi:MAG: NAD/NADP octopine/nopaline dehydrogenase family protein [Betaproteobacteria bacterium]|nr:NAD/NADP octopine/nopaline dehydrogenase family protein [Betaproteobacteria bacterium]
MKIAVLGGGSVAFANASYLSSKGHQVHIWSALPGELSPLSSVGAISTTGELEGKWKVTVAETAASAIEGAGVVIIAAPAFAHRVLMEAAAPHLVNEQDVIVHPVTGMSSLILSRLVGARAVKPTIIDLSTSLFTARRNGEASVQLLRIKPLIEAASIPIARCDKSLARLAALYGDRFRAEENVLAVSLNNHNPIYHVPTVLGALSRADRGDTYMFFEQMTPTVCVMQEALDAERLAVARAFGAPEVPVAQYFREAHSAQGNTLAEIYVDVQRRLKGPLGPQTADHRFVTEDVPYALLFFYDLGQAAGIAMPVTDAVLTLTSATWQQNFRVGGHGLPALGLDGLKPAQILEIARNGF